MMRFFAVLMLAATVLAGCSLSNSPVDAANPQDAVAVIINDNSPASKEVGEYYVSKRKIPAKNVIRIKCQTTESLSLEKYLEDIEKPVKAHISKNDPTRKIDYLVLTKGIPHKTDPGWSVDGLLMCMFQMRNLEDNKAVVMNPYLAKDEHFSRRKYGFFLATRLDGYTVEDAKALVDRSLAAKPLKGEFLIDTTPHRDNGGYRLMNDAMKHTHAVITKNGYTSVLEDTEKFASKHTRLMGYFSWGSNDKEFDVDGYRSNKFLPGAIAETAVSTSGRTFVRTTEGQSLIADLIESGVTGVKGYVAEPTLGAIAHPGILFGSYLSGYNLAESFYMASARICWRDIVLGDPLCAPYAK